MSLKRTGSQSNASAQHGSDARSSRTASASIQMSDGNGRSLAKSAKLVEVSQQKRAVPPDKLKRMRQVFNTVGSSQPMPVERLAEAFTALDRDPRRDIRFEDFLIEHELTGTPGGTLDFEHFALLVLAYEEKLRVEDEAIRRLDLKIAFECFDMNKDGLIDANELSMMMNLLDLPITEQEAREMLDFADHDKDSFLSFDEFLTVLTQISAIHATSD